MEEGRGRGMMSGWANKSNGKGIWTKKRGNDKNV
jgi:hypothetical protein